MNDEQIIFRLKESPDFLAGFITTHYWHAKVKDNDVKLPWVFLITLLSNLLEGLLTVESLNAHELVALENIDHDLQLEYIVISD